jgi:hypothetical protein
MAILESVPGIKVTVRVGGTEALEYNDPDATENQWECPTSSKYIESVDDTEFAIIIEVESNYDFNNNTHFLHSWVYVDEVLIDITTIDHFDVLGKKYSSEIVGEKTFDSKRGYSLQKLRFVPLKTSKSGSPSVLL